VKDLQLLSIIHGIAADLRIDQPDLPILSMTEKIVTGRGASDTAANITQLT